MPGAAGPDCACGGVDGAGVALRAAAPAGAGAQERTLRRRHFAPAHPAATADLLFLRARCLCGASSAKIGRATKNTRAMSPINLNRHDTPLVTAAGTGETAGSSAVGGHDILRDVGCEKDAALDLRQITGALPCPAMPKISTDRCQAAGGARDRKKTGRERLALCSAANVSAIRSNPSGTGNCGGCAASEVEARKIEAQIAQ